MKSSLNYFIENIKGSLKEIYFVLIIIIVGLLGFGLGRLSKIEDRKVPITITGQSASMVSVPKEAELQSKTGQSAPATGGYVASKSGSSFYLPWCAGVKRIKEANKVWFNTKAEALAAGYSPASNCKGI